MEFVHASDERTWEKGEGEVYLEGGVREERDKKIIRQERSDKQGIRARMERQTHWNCAPET